MEIGGIEQLVDDASQDIYTCGVCLEKIFFKDLTNHVFLHDEYQAFSYDENTRIIEPITEAVKNNLLDVQADQEQGDSQSYNNVSTASALVDLGATDSQQSSILYDQHGQQTDLSSSIINLQNDAGVVSGVQGITQIPMSAFLEPDANIETALPHDTVVEVQGNQNDTKKVQYVTVSKPPKVGIPQKNKAQSIATFLVNPPQLKLEPKLSTLNEIFVWNKNRSLVRGELVTKVQVPIIENGVSRMTECSIIFNNYIPDSTLDSYQKLPQAQLGTSGEKFEEVQAVEGLDDMDFTVYMDHSAGTSSVLTYKKMGNKSNFKKRTPKTGRQMENYRWKDTKVVDDVTRELQKSLLPKMVKGSPAVAKYLQAMNIAVDGIDVEEAIASVQSNEPDKLADTMENEQQQHTDMLVENNEELQQSGMPEDNIEKNVPKKVIINLNPPNPPQRQNQEPDVIVENAESVAVYNEPAVEKAVDSLIEAQAPEENAPAVDKEVENEKITVDDIVIDPLEAENRVKDVKDKSGEAVNEEKIESKKGNEIATMTPVAHKKGAQNQEAEVSEKLKDNDAADVSNFVEMAVKMDGTVSETTESETEAVPANVVPTNVRKSVRLKIKKEKKDFRKEAGERSDDEGADGVGRKRPQGKVNAEDIVKPPVKRVAYFCSLCNKKLPQNTVLKEHLEWHRTAKKISKQVSKPGQQNVIIATPNKMLLYYCSLCNKMFPSEVELKEHCQQHKKDQDQSCQTEDSPDDFDDAEAEFEDATDLESYEYHVFKKKRRISRYRKSYIPPIHTCDTCGFTSRNSTTMKVHRKTHEGDGLDWHRCPLGCGQRFKTEMEVDLHGPFCQKNHDLSGSKNIEEEEVVNEILECPYCSKRCHTKPALHYHSLVCKSRPFDKCNLCDFMCRGTLPMSRHKVKMHNLKPYKCETCGKTFQLKGSLRDHITANHSENKHVCEHCGKKFSKLNVYKRHVFVQHGGFRYPCNYCPKKYKDKRCWRIHENSHKAAYEYACLQCKKSFSKAPDYKQHMLEVHNIESQEALDLNKAAKELRMKLCKLLCPHCKEKFPLETAFIHHLQTKHMLSEEQAFEVYKQVSGEDDAAVENEFIRLQTNYPMLTSHIDGRPEGIPI